MKLSHKQKVKIAKRLMSNKEKRTKGQGIFTSDNWLDRVWNKQRKQLNQGIKNK
jgi:hypothetical protein